MKRREWGARSFWTRLMGTVAAGLMAVTVLAGGSAQAAKPVKIGFGMALTGALAGGGHAALLAMQIWADDVNKKGGLLGRPVELVYYDDQTKPANIPAIYSKLLDVDKVDFVVSGYGTNLAAAAMPIVMERKKVFLSLFATAANEKFKYPYYFSMFPAGPNPIVDFSTGFFELAAKQTPKPKTVALLGDDAEYPRNALEGARVNAKKYGFQIVYDKFFQPGTPDLTPTLRAIKALNPDLLYVATYPPGSVAVVKAAKEVDIKPKLFGSGLVGLQFTTIQMNLGPVLNNLLVFHLWVPEPTLKFPGTEDLIKKYQARAAGKKIDPLGYYIVPQAYAYVQILGQAVEATKTLDNVAVGKYIHAHEFNTVVGKVRFTKDGEWAKSRMLQIQFQNVKKAGDINEFNRPGRLVVVYPPDLASGKLVYPFPGFK